MGPAIRGLPRSVTVQRLDVQGVETVQGFSGTRCHPDAANFVYMLASGAFSSNRSG